MWVVAGMSIFSTASLVQQVSADETPVTNTTVQNETKEAIQSDKTTSVSEVEESAPSSQEVDPLDDKKEQASEVSESKQATEESEDVSKVDQPHEEVVAKEIEGTTEQSVPKEQGESVQAEADTATKKVSEPTEEIKAQKEAKKDEVAEQSTVSRSSDNKVQATAEDIVADNDVTEIKTDTSATFSDQKQEIKPAKVKSQVNGLQQTEESLAFLELEKDLAPLKRTARSVSTNKLETSLLATTASAEPQIASATDGSSIGLTSLTQGDAKGSLSAPKVLDDGSKEVLSTTWSSTQSTEAVVSPTVAGYVANKSIVSATQLDYNSKNLEDTISYYVGEQLVTIHYIDVNGVKNKDTGYTPSDGKGIVDFIQHLSGEAGTKYSNRLKDYSAKGYELVYAQSEASEGMFDEDTNKQQDYYVYLDHGTKTTTGVPVTITDTINYVYGNGPHKGEPAFPPSVVEKVFTPTYVIDKVTGETIETVWNGDGTIDPSVVPALDGYTPDKLVVAGRVLTPDMKNQSQTVYYYVASELDIPETPSTPTTVGEGEESSQKVQANQRQVPSEGSNQVLDQNQIVNREVVGELPQTGDEDDKESILLGLGLLSGAALLGATELGQRKRKKRN